MNPTTIDPSQPPPPPPQQTQPPRSSFSCDKHPHEQFTGFCPECLCERLTTLDNNNNNNNASSSSSIKSLFSKPTSFFPELRRSKSFSASKNEALFKASAIEPQRKSCDVRGRNTLSSLFSIDDETKSIVKPNPTSNEDSGFVGKPVKEEEEETENVVDEEEITSTVDNEVEPEIVVVEEVNADILKPMKDHIHVDLDSQTKKAKKESFWSAASVFSKKWQNWRKKQKLKKRNNGENSGNFNLPVSKPISRRCNNRDTQSEIADYGFGRRSCDTDPRFSLDAGRISFDDPRYSFDEPRASWDGYLIGNCRSTFPRMPPMVSVIEDAPIVQIPRYDGQIPVEEPRFSVTSINEDEPGGSTQTKEYYSDSSLRRRKSLDRSNSIRKTAAAVVAEINNAKVLPAMVGDQFLGANVLVGGERDLNSNSNSNSNSLRDDCSETFELTGFRDNGGSVIGNGERKESKKTKRWAWNLWGFIHRRVSGNKENEEDDGYSRSNGVGRSFSESWQDLRSTNGDVRGSINRKVFRSNSSVSWRSSTSIGGSFGGSVRKSGVEMNGGNVKKKRDDIVLERNWSARYSPNHIDNGLLRFYLTPMKGSRRGVPGKTRPNGGSHSIARSLLRLY